MAEEYVQREVTGDRGQHVAVTHYFFDGDDCYGGRREYSNLMMHVIHPKIYWDLYYDGKLLATVDPEGKSVDYVKVSDGMEFTKNLSSFKLTKNGKLVRVWDLDEEQLKILPQDELERLSQRDSGSDNPEFKKLLKQYGPQFQAPTKMEAEEKMQKAKNL